MKIFKQLSMCIFIVSLFFANSSQVLSQGNPVPGTPSTPTPPAPQQVAIKFTNPLANQSGDLMQLITDILNKIVLPIASICIIGWIVWAGFQFVIAQGNTTAIDKAKSNLLWSLIGAGILLGAAAISKVLESTINSLMS